MLIVLSPAKTLDETPVKPVIPTTAPVLMEDSALLAAKLKTYTPARLKKLMDISPELVALNHARYQIWADAAATKPAALLFHGEAYRGLDAKTLDAADMRFAQRHLRILSGLYGVLKPMDLIAPHRLEMGTKLSMGRGKKDLYAFWGDRVNAELNAALAKNKADVLVNLASAEYFKSVRPGSLNARVITPVFKEQTPKGLNMVAVFAKHQRGAMCRWAIKRRLVEPECLKEYDGDGYAFHHAESTVDEWLFVR